MNGMVRLVNKTSPASLQGNPAIFLDNQWAVLQSTTATENDGKVICRQLGLVFSAMGAAYPYTGHPIYNLRCSGKEKSINECPYKLITTFSRYNQRILISCTGNEFIFFYISSGK